MGYYLPKLKNDKDFEELCRDIMNIYYPNCYDIYGRNGQKQHGIDIIPNNVYSPFAQCKNYHTNNKNTISKFNKEIENDYTAAKNFFNCSEFIVFTSLDRDVNIHKHILYLQENNKKIIICFWEEITKCILSHKDLLKTYYPLYFNHDDFEKMQSQEDVYIKNIVELINNNISTINNISLTSEKSSDFYNGLDFYDAYLEIENQFSLIDSKRIRYIRDFFILIDMLLNRMAINSVPNAYNPEIRVIIPTSKLTFDEFEEIKKSAHDLFKIINRLL